MTTNKRKNSNFMGHALCLLLVFCMLFVTGCGNGGLIIYPDNQTTTETMPDDSEISQEATVNGKLEVHFIDVGQADCILIKKDHIVFGVNNGTIIPYLTPIALFKITSLLLILSF